jgi:hypothetical protein
MVGIQGIGAGAERRGVEEREERMMAERLREVARGGRGRGLGEESGVEGGGDSSLATWGSKHSQYNINMSLSIHPPAIPCSPQPVWPIEATSRPAETSAFIPPDFRCPPRRRERDRDKERETERKKL